jgi:hypothetical protein
VRELTGPCWWKFRHLYVRPSVIVV